MDQSSLAVFYVAGKGRAFLKKRITSQKGLISFVPFSQENGSQSTDIISIWSLSSCAYTSGIDNGEFFIRPPLDCLTRLATGLMGFEAKS